MRAFAEWKGGDPARAGAYARVARAREQAGHLAREAPMLALRHEAVTRAMLRRRPFWKRPRMIAAAAVLAATAPLAAWTIRQWAPAPAARVLTASYHTGIGQQADVTLPDGSKVTLDTDSRMTVRFDGNDRQVSLDGQGWFEVPGRGAPLTIVAGGRRFEAGAGRFDIRTDEDRVRAYNADGRLALAGEAPVAIGAGRLLAAGGNMVTIRPLARPATFIGWRHGLLQFEDVTLAQATDELNRYRLRPIRLADGRAAALRISGAFRTTESPAFVDALASGFPVRVRDAGAGGIVVASR